jgi:hypothetical protein
VALCPESSAAVVVGTSAVRFGMPANCHPGWLQGMGWDAQAPSYVMYPSSGQESMFPYSFRHASPRWSYPAMHVTAQSYRCDLNAPCIGGLGHGTQSATTSAHPGRDVVPYGQDVRTAP